MPPSVRLSSETVAVLGPEYLDSNSISISSSSSSNSTSFDSLAAGEKKVAGKLLFGRSLPLPFSADTAEREELTKLNKSLSSAHLAETCNLTPQLQVLSSARSSSPSPSLLLSHHHLLRTESSSLLFSSLVLLTLLFQFALRARSLVSSLLALLTLPNL